LACCELPPPPGNLLLSHVIHESGRGSNFLRTIRGLQDRVIGTPTRETTGVRSQPPLKKGLYGLIRELREVAVRQVGERPGAQGAQRRAREAVRPQGIEGFDGGRCCRNGKRGGRGRWRHRWDEPRQTAAGRALEKSKDETGATLYRIAAPARATRPHLCQTRGYP
jgi:hypothetical protein